MGNATSWQRGQSGNPSGRPRSNAAQVDARALAQAHSVRAVARLAELLEHADPHVALRAAAALLDRGFGKPSVEVVALSVEEHEDPVARLDRLLSWVGDRLRAAEMPVARSDAASEIAKP